MFNILFKKNVPNNSTYNHLMCSSITQSQYATQLIIGPCTTLAHTAIQQYTRNIRTQYHNHHLFGKSFVYLTQPQQWHYYCELCFSMCSHFFSASFLCRCYFLLLLRLYRCSSLHEQCSCIYSKLGPTHKQRVDGRCTTLQSTNVVEQRLF